MTKAQGDRIIELLEGIANRLDAYAEMMVQPEGCEHPDDQRINLSSMGDANHWVCRICRFDNKATPQS